MLALNFKRVESFVETQQKAGNDVRWDGWTLVFFKPADRAIYVSQGVYRNGTWGIETRIEVDSKGLWQVPYQNLKRIPKSGPAKRK